MGRRQDQEKKLFCTRLHLDKRIRKDHPLRQISRQIEFDFVYNEVKERKEKNQTAYFDIREGIIR